MLPLLYLPLRGATGGTFADGESAAFLAQPDQFLSYVSGRGFEGDFFYFINTRPDLFLDRVKLLPTLFDFQFNWLVFVLFAIGAVRVIWKDWKLAIMLLGGIVLHTFVTLAYRAPQTVEYLMPAYVLLAIVVGYGLKPFGVVFLRITYHVLRCCVSRVAWQSCLLFINHFPSFTWLRDQRGHACLHRRIAQRRAAERDPSFQLALGQSAVVFAAGRGAAARCRGAVRLSARRRRWRNRG